MTATTTLITPEDRVENIRRVSEVAKLMTNSGMIVMLRSKFARRGIQRISTKKPERAKSGDFTGIDTPYEAPDDPEIVVHTDQQTVDESAATILEQLLPRLREYQGND